MDLIFTPLLWGKSTYFVSKYMKFWFSSIEWSLRLSLVSWEICMFSYINIKEVTVKSVFYLGSPRLKLKKSPKGLPLSIPIQIFLDKPTPNLKTPVESSVNEVYFRHNIHPNLSTHTILCQRLMLIILEKTCCLGL